MGCSRFSYLTTLVGFAAWPVMLTAQAAVDPSVAPRAAQLARAGDRPRATEMLGRYLATAPDDGSAWLELGRFYLLDSREWHRAGHAGEPAGSLFLDFSATALDQSLRLPTDSSYLLRALVEVDRAAQLVEQLGWSTLRARFVIPARAGPPAYVAEIGRNLVNSCPVGGIFVTGSDMEAVAVWNVVLSDRRRGDLVLLLPARYQEDSAYRAKMAEALSVAPGESLHVALASVASRRPVCFSPAVEIEVGSGLVLTPERLVRVVGPAIGENAEPLSVVELLQVVHSRPGPVSGEVLGLYRAAARFNPLLCSSIIAPLGTHPRDGCGR
jgi:hypothetical protein